MVSMEDVRRAIDPEEPDYLAAASSLGREALPFLAELAEGPDAMTASKAVSLAGLIGGDDAVPIITRAAQADRAELRIVAVAAAGGLGRNGEEVVADLLGDDDAGVRKYAVRAVGEQPSARIRRLLEDRREVESDTGVRRGIEHRLRTMPPSG
jgi:HEAT repeat protein